MKVDQIWTYPVKSMLGSVVDHAELDAGGIVGDRMWALRDETRGAIASARTMAPLSVLTASFADEVRPGTVSIQLSDGSQVTSADPDANDRLTAAVGAPVTLHAKPPESDADFYRRSDAGDADIMAHLKAIFGRVDDEPLPDFSIFPPELMEFEYPPGNFFDCYPLMIMSTSALRSLREALPESAIDERRFRPSFVVDTGDEPGHPEFAWAGRRLRVGETELQIGAPCPRCVAVTRKFGDDLPADRSVLRHIVRDLDQNVGVYATVVTGGPISVGDSVELV